MHLGVEREPTTLEPLDDVELPRRPGEVELMAVQPRDQNAELALVARTGQRGATHVVVEVEVLVLDPRLERVAQQERVGQLHVPRSLDRFLARLVEDVAQVGRSRVGRWRERHQRGHVHHRLGCLGPQEHRVLRRDAPLGGHGLILPHASGLRARTPVVGVSSPSRRRPPRRFRPPAVSTAPGCHRPAPVRSRRRTAAVWSVPNPRSTVANATGRVSCTTRVTARASSSIVASSMRPPLGA